MRLTFFVRCVAVRRQSSAIANQAGWSNLTKHLALGLLSLGQAVAVAEDSAVCPKGKGPGRAQHRSHTSRDSRTQVREGRLRGAGLNPNPPKRLGLPTAQELRAELLNRTTEQWQVGTVALCEKLERNESHPGKNCEKLSRASKDRRDCRSSIW